MNLYEGYVREIARNLKAAKNFPLGEADFPAQEIKSENSPVALIFSPHPDDECVVGGLPLRLLRETNFRIINIPITLGSDLKRRRARREELENACRYLGFEIKDVSADGFDRITPTGREENPENWQSATNKVKNLLDELQPQIIFFPHRNDKHPAHCGTNFLISDALGLMPPDFACLTIETEFWQALEFPNLMIEFDEKIVGDLVTALGFHVGEVERNPYHLILPHQMIDNVRRGSEILTSPGASGQDFIFAGLYKVSTFKGGKFYAAYEEGKFIPVSEKTNLISQPLFSQYKSTR